MNRVLEREAATTVRDGMALAAGWGAGFAILDRTFFVQANPVARRLCADWGPEGGDGMNVEDARARLAPAARARSREMPTNCTASGKLLVAPIRTRRPSASSGESLHARVPGLAASSQWLCPRTSELAEPAFVIELERRSIRRGARRRRCAGTVATER